MTQKTGLSAFIDELRRRRVFRVAAFYGGIAFVIVQIIDGTFEVMGIPAWVSRLMIIILAVGFPISMILAWVFDITPEGIVRTEGRSKGKPGTSNRALVAVTIAAIAFGIWGRWGGPGVNAISTSEPSLGPNSIAVLPFANLSDSKADEYFSDGVTDDIITHITKIGALKVISRTSAMLYKNSPKSLRVIADELGVANILEGTVRRAGDRVRITGQLIDARTDEHLWAETYDRDLTDIFAIQSDVARKIAAALNAILSPEESQRLQQRPTESSGAYDYYLRAIEYNRQSMEKNSIELSIDLYKKAIALDSNFAQAYARLGKNHGIMYWEGYDRTIERRALAGEAINQALRLKPEDPTVRLANGYYYYHGFRDYARALEEFYFARKMEPGNGSLAGDIGYIQRRLGNFEEAVNNQKTAIEYDPRSSRTVGELGFTYLIMRRFDLAEQSFENAIVLAPDNPILYFLKAWTQVRRTGNTNSARRVLADGMRLAGPNYLLWTLVDFDIEEGRYRDALERLALIKEDVWENQWTITPKEAYFGWIFELMEKPADARRHFENALARLEERVLESPDDPRVYAALGKVYAHLGMVEDALLGSRRAVDLLPLSLDAMDGPLYLENLAEVYAMIGENDKALDILEHLLEIPSWTSIGSLKFHRVWDPLREHPRFQALLEKYGETI